MSWWILFLPAFCLVAANDVRAEIYEWRDDSGSRHFTNILEEVPAAERTDPKVLVRETTRSGVGDPVVPSAPPSAEAERPREALLIYDRSQPTNDYAAGVLDGVALAEHRNQPVRFTINGPLAVANSEAQSSDTGYLADDYYPFVTTSFDRGRSRHRTLRMLLQDQFQLDRDGPYLYERVNPIGLGPRLQPFLARGLPHRIPPGHRVLFR